MALAPQSAFMKTKDKNGKDVLLINLAEGGQVTTEFNGQLVTVIVSSEFPEGTKVTLKVETKGTANLA